MVDRAELQRLGQVELGGEVVGRPVAVGEAVGEQQALAGTTVPVREGEGRVGERWSRQAAVSVPLVRKLCSVSGTLITPSPSTKRPNLWS